MTYDGMIHAGITHDEFFLVSRDSICINRDKKCPNIKD